MARARRSRSMATSSVGGGGGSATAASARLTVAAGLLAAHTVDGPAPGDRRRPGPHRAAAAVEARRLAPDLEEDLLSDLLGMARIVEHPLAHADRRAGRAGRRARRTRRGRLRRPGPSARRRRPRCPSAARTRSADVREGPAPSWFGAEGRTDWTSDRHGVPVVVDDTLYPYGVELATAVTSGVLPGCCSPRSCCRRRRPRRWAAGAPNRSRTRSRWPPGCRRTRRLPRRR